MCLLRGTHPSASTSTWLGRGSSQRLRNNVRASDPRR